MLEKLKEIMRKKWPLDILNILAKKGELNYKDLRNEFGISSETLTSTKDILLDYDLIERNRVKRDDIRYRITSKGESFLEKAKEMNDIL